MSIFDLFKKIEKEKSDVRPISAIIAGLGNPESKYARTRHNIGFDAIDCIAKKRGVKIDTARFHALTGDCLVGSERVLLMKPQTYMNASGEAVGEAARFYKIPPEKVIVICDDINLAVGGLRIRKSGSAGGHNGLKSIIEHLGSEDFVRLRVGAGRLPEGGDMVSWVLGRAPACDRQALLDRLEDCSDALEMVVSGDIDGAMGKFNRKA